MSEAAEAATRLAEQYGRALRAGDAQLDKREMAMLRALVAESSGDASEYFTTRYPGDPSGQVLDSLARSLERGNRVGASVSSVRGHLVRQAEGIALLVAGLASAPVWLATVLAAVAVSVLHAESGGRAAGVTGVTFLLGAGGIVLLLGQLLMSQAGGLGSAVARLLGAPWRRARSLGVAADAVFAEHLVPALQSAGIEQQATPTVTRQLRRYAGLFLGVSYLVAAIALGAFLVGALHGIDLGYKSYRCSHGDTAFCF